MSSDGVEHIESCRSLQTITSTKKDSIYREQDGSRFVARICDTVGIWPCRVLRSLSLRMSFHGDSTQTTITLKRTTCQQLMFIVCDRPKKTMTWTISIWWTCQRSKLMRPMRSTSQILHRFRHCRCKLFLNFFYCLQRMNLTIILVVIIIITIHNYYYYYDYISRIYSLNKCVFYFQNLSLIQMLVYMVSKLLSFSQYFRATRDVQAHSHREKKHFPNGKPMYKYCICLIK